MSKLSFYRQKRVDGSIRTGIEVEESTVWHHFQLGEGEPDPVLLWFVDLRCEGKNLPTGPEEARDWFLSQAPVIRRAFQNLAEELRAGMEPTSFPCSDPFPGSLVG